MHDHEKATDQTRMEAANVAEEARLESKKAHRL